MAKLENSLKNMFLSLTVITVVVGGLLGAVAMVTADPIAQATAAAQTEAIKAVAPEFDAVGEATTSTSTNGEAATIFPVMKGGQEVGKAVTIATAPSKPPTTTVITVNDRNMFIKEFSSFAIVVITF